MKHTLIAAILIFTILSEVAQAGDYYMDISVTRQNISLEQGGIKPYMGRVKAGFDYSDKLAFEFVYGTELQDDVLNNQSIDVEMMLGLYARYNTPFNNNMRIYLFAGKTQITLTESDVLPKNEFTDVTYGIGVEEVVPWQRDTLYVLELTQYVKEGANKITGITLGLRFNFL